MYSRFLCTEIVYVLIIVPWIMVLLRTYTRHFVVRAFAWDDALALIAMVSTSIPSPEGIDANNHKDYLHLSAGTTYSGYAEWRWSSKSS